MSDLDILLKAASKLTSQRVRILVEMANALGRQVEVEASPDSDLMTPLFVEDFTARLIVYHAMHEEKITKKTFEYIFRGASSAAGYSAELTGNPVNPGADVTVDGTKFSLKTEAAKNLSVKCVHISKFMEARWIRNCRTEADFAREACSRIIAHLASYDRIIVLRASDLSEGRVQYSLIEIPVNLLRLVKNLDVADFTRPTRNGSSSAKVKVDGLVAFTVRLDGSVEKVTMAGLRTDLCIEHASWALI